MSKERDLLVSCLDEFQYHEVPCSDLIRTIKWLLNEPEQSEQEPVAWRTYRVVTDDWQYHIFPYGLDLTCQPLYTAPPKREPLGDGITADMYRANKKATHPDSYWAGVYDAEKAHGIGGGE